MRFCQINTVVIIGVFNCAASLTLFHLLKGVCTEHHRLLQQPPVSLPLLLFSSFHKNTFYLWDFSLSVQINALLSHHQLHCTICLTLPAQSTKWRHKHTETTTCKVTMTGEVCFILVQSTHRALNVMSTCQCLCCSPANILVNKRKCINTCKCQWIFNR